MDRIAVNKISGWLRHGRRTKPKCNMAGRATIRLCVKGGGGGSEGRRRGCQIDAQTVMGKHGRQGRKGTAHVALTAEKQPRER